MNTMNTVSTTSAIVSAIVTETQQAVARGAHRRSMHKSPYKKSLSRADALSLRVVTSPTDRNINAWSEKVLLNKIGINSSKFDPAVYAELRKTAKQLQHTSVYKSFEITNFLVDTVKFTMNHADEQLELLRKAIHSAEEKSKLSSNQMTHDRIGTQQSRGDSLKPEAQKKQINTTGVV